MLRALFTTTLICSLPGMATAQDIVLRADIAEATVYGFGAEVTRRATTTIPLGTHRVFVAIPDVEWIGILQVSGPDNVQIGPPQEVLDVPIGEGTLDTADQTLARQAVDAAEDAVLLAEDNIARADAAIMGTEAQLAYLTALTQGGSDGAAMPDDPAELARILGTLGTETARLSEALVGLRADRRSLEDALDALQSDLETAQDALDRLRAFGDSVNGLGFEVTTTSDTDATFEITYFAQDVGWRPSYELALQSETGALTLTRSFVFIVDSDSIWEDVNVTFSTENPSRQREPRAVLPSRVRIAEPAPRTPVASLDLRGQTEVAIEPVVIAEDRAPNLAIVEGLSLSYTYGTPVSVGPDTVFVQLPFDEIALEMNTEARAVPRRDNTAFLIAMGENTTGEPILPGEARFFRDGAFIGEDEVALVPPGAEIEFAFGPLDHLRLEWIDRSLAEGDEGIFTSSNTQEREIAFGVENLSNEPETVRILYATPFAEQEDLDIELSLDPEPTERDVDDLRGVHAWEVDVAPGETELIEMEVELRWPEGQVLNWRP
ncbi:MAG: mucoidy inhibitor MuiA family protein [Pseudomonadota bacterium]